MAWINHALDGISMVLGFSRVERAKFPVTKVSLQKECKPCLCKPIMYWYPISVSSPETILAVHLANPVYYSGFPWSDAESGSIQCCNAAPSWLTRE